jgi:hypothetical protein
MNTSQHLSNLGVTMEQCRSFIAANLDKPANIFNVAKQYNIDSQMLAEIVQDQFPGVNAAQVEAFFSQHGLNGKDLNAATLNPTPIVQSWQGDSPINALFALNNNVGVLSNEAMRTAVVSKVGIVKYMNTFSTQYIPGSADGVLSAADLGFSQIGDIKATWQNIESLYYGTMIKMLRNMTYSEVSELNTFVIKNQSAMLTEDPEVLRQFEKLMIDMFTDPPTAVDRSALSDFDIAQGVQSGLVAAVPLVGVDPNQNLFNVFE